MVNDNLEDGYPLQVRPLSVMSRTSECSILLVEFQHSVKKTQNKISMSWTAKLHDTVFLSHVCTGEEIYPVRLTYPGE